MHAHGGKKSKKHKGNILKSRPLTPVIQFFLLWGGIGVGGTK